MKKAIDFLTAKPARFFLLAALLWGGLMCYLNSKDGPNFHWHDLLVEANGMVFDLLVFGILLSVYEALREKKEKIERLHEEIDDYRGWDEKEAMYRVVGAIKRLIKLGETNIKLNSCFLLKASLQGANLQGADLMLTNLQGANLQGANLKKTNLRWANLQGANLRGADLREADLQGANLQGAELQGAELQGANLRGADFQSAYIYKADFQGAHLQDINLELAKVGDDWSGKFEVYGLMIIEEIKEKYTITKGWRLLRK